MRLATKARRAAPRAVRRPRKPQETSVVACHQEWSGTPPQREARTEARNCPSKEASRSWSRRSPLMPKWYMTLDTSAQCLLSTIPVGARSTPVVAERISSQARTDSQARALVCSREVRRFFTTSVTETDVQKEPWPIGFDKNMCFCESKHKTFIFDIPCSQWWHVCFRPTSEQHTELWFSNRIPSRRHAHVSNAMCKCNVDSLS